MDTGFTIDDVRDTLTSDITRFLGKIESGAREILERKDLGVEALPAALTVFETIGDHGHAIYGTSRLVQAGSLADSAAGLEALAQRGRDELARAVVHLSRAREIAGAIVGGAGDMLAMLSLELDHRSQEASAIAAGWRQRVESVTGSIAALHGREASNGNGRAVGESTADLGPMLSIATARAVAKPVPALPPSSAVVDDEWSFAGSAADAPVTVPRMVLPVAVEDRFSFGGSVDERVESIDLTIFDMLEAGDLLFIDSSHVIRPWGDVLREFLEIVPRVKSGVYVHVHDIFTPFDYPEHWLRQERRLWNEQYLLEAFLSFNERFEIVCAANWLKTFHWDAFSAACPKMQQNPGQVPGAFWFKAR